ncbi:hypothetical protein [Actinoallomurus sp. NPDC050550]|uniref:hypothetical protein n=1 Tax=Actinoallomurus sp. NPDC050550 TaxID=3154937 RepID=UPI0033CDEEA1
MAAGPQRAAPIPPGSYTRLYDLVTDPDKLLNVYEHPEMAEVRGRLLRRLYQVLRDRGDNF